MEETWLLLLLPIVILKSLTFSFEFDVTFPDYIFF